MTAQPDPALPTTEAEHQSLEAARPDRGNADDGKSGGRSMGGTAGVASVAGGGAGINAQTGKPSGKETERVAPGISTDKKADDTK